MTTTSLYFDKRYDREDGKYPLKIKITAFRRSYMHNTSIFLAADQWKDNEVVKHDNKKILNQIVRKQLSDINNVIMTLELRGEPTIDKIKKALTSPKEYSFTTHFNKFMSTRVKPTTREIYLSTLRKIEVFSDSDVFFSDINVSWLKSFEAFLREQGLSVNAINLHIRNIRAVFNDAINEDIVEQNLYPFRKFKLKKEATQKRSLTIDQLRTIRDYPCEQHAKQYVDIFMLIFYFCGINIVDLSSLKEIKDGRVEYRRAKTGRLYSIKVEPEAMKIIERYKGDNYLLNILDRYQDYRNYTHRLNKNLKELGDVKVGKQGKKTKEGLFPQLSTYWARHTWATIAASLDIPKETIAAALGHGGDSVTDIYINFDRKKIDQANRKVISAIKIKRPLRSLK